MNQCNDGRCERARKGEKHPIHDLTEIEENRISALKELMTLGSELTGGSIGAAIGFVLAGGSGAAAGSVIGTGMGHILKQVGNEVATRYLSPREKKRMGAVFIHATNKIKENLERGDELRNDGFFVHGITERSAASEVI